ncbi:MAG: SpoIIE family protein phosphatase [Bacteroidota bacterium]
MKKIAVIVCLLIIVQGFVVAQINKSGIPLIRNYDPQLYNASDQNWAVVQDFRGIMYFGNNDDGILEYDGINWKKIKVSNNSTVRSLAVDSNGTVFVGAVGEFGYLAPDRTGRLKYVSLVNLLDSANRQFINVWQTYATHDAVYFCTVSAIFRYDYKTVRVFQTLPEASFFSFMIGEKLYTGNYLEGLLTIDNYDSLVKAPGGDFFQRKNIMVMLPYDDRLVVVGTSYSGLFVYDPYSGEIIDSLMAGEINERIKYPNILYSACKLDDNRFLFGTITGGALVVDKQGNIENVLNPQVGLMNEIIYYAYHNKYFTSQPLWFALDKGISKIHINSPFRYFGEESGLKGGVIDIVRFNGILYVATVSGVYYLMYENNTPVFKPVDNIAVPWSFYIFSPPGEESKLLVGTVEGLYEIKNLDRVELVEDQIVNPVTPGRKYYIYKVYGVQGDDKLYMGTNKGLLCLSYKDKKWRIVFEYEELNAEIRSIAIDKSKNIWAATAFDGIYRLTETDDTIIYTHYNQESGIPSLKATFIYNYNDRLIFGTEKGFYRYTKDDDRFIADATFDSSFTDGSKAVYKFVEDKFGNYWVSLSNNDPNYIKRWMEVITPTDNGFLVNAVPFRTLPNLVIEAIFNDDEGITWIGNSSGLYGFDRNFKRPYDNKFHAIIREVSVGEDTIIFHGAYYRQGQDSMVLVTLGQPESFIPELQYKYRNLTFSFSAPYFDEEGSVMYSYFLEGYSKTWSKWSTEPKAGFTNLPEGDYIFKVKAQNIFGFESEEASYTFSIIPPWYRTIYAYIAYIIVGGFLLWLIIKLYTRKLQNDKIRLEQIVAERTAEVVSQRDEIKQQSDKIAEINKELTDSILYAKRIQRAILPHEEFANELFDDHFILFKPKDIVSGDFYWLTKIEQFTIITAADCTGHGVPGAFMSMLGVAFLNEIVKNKKIRSTGEVLNQLRDHVIRSLQQTGKEGEQKDGMDIALCAINNETGRFQFSGANNPLYLVRNTGHGDSLSLQTDNGNITLEPSMTVEEFHLYEVKGDKMPVAIHVIMDSFTSYEIELKKGDTLYLFSDGFADQFGGAKGKKFMYKPFKTLLMDLQKQKMSEQRQALDKAIEDWKAHPNAFSGEAYEQVDDIVVVGVRVM